MVGDSVWDLLAAQRAGALGIGLLSGGYGREEFERSGAYRVYADPAEMLTRLEEVGGPSVTVGSDRGGCVAGAARVDHGCVRARVVETEALNCRSLARWPMPPTCGTTPSWCPRG